ncbi:hypothetical protein Dalk_5208 [Desulfatibacillum aliphaticivorans]|uniref:Uncharacterized protein n=1 Tax=Desulfatibacillum aliphaticivorans TaxID=218208 RepID=B8FE97_DESAL|nr:hypothetical protein [Desulfatibacillum aliphaticivorans]ACL06878.1 hypothetical protein Dalk_5208 [Desulfatibacillum aliphaticivorans]
MSGAQHNKGVRHCPFCKQKAGIRIIYGSPPIAVYLLHLKGEVILGQCRSNKSSPDWHCKACGCRWNERTAAIVHPSNV